MPRLDGTSFHRELEKIDPAMARKVLFVTGDVAGTEAERFLEETSCRWLAKPFRLKDLLRVAREMLGDVRGGFRVPGSVRMVPSQLAAESVARVAPLGISNPYLSLIPDPYIP